MAINESTSPYHNDYDEDKQFLKILFKPSVAVQVREMNQLQTFLQKQVSRLGDHFFVEGSMVIPGEVNYDLAFAYAKLTLVDPYEDVAAAILNAGVTVEGTGGLTADVLDFVNASGADPITVYLKYNGSGTTGEVSAFTTASTITFKDSLGNTITTATVDETGFGSKVSVNRGIYYINGQFVLVTDQNVIVEKYSPTPTKKVGLVFSESVVTAFDDDSLLDNALGTPNYTAPGADRSKMTVTLTSLDVADTTSNFVELIRFDAGNVENLVDKTQYSILADTLARRTFDQSGDFTVNPFNIVLADHPTDTTKIRVGLEPGKAYVKGYEIGTTATQYVNVNKARDTELFNNSVTIAEFGNYVLVESAYGLPDVATCDEIEFYTGAVTVPGSMPSGTKIATAYVRHIEQISATQWKIYVFGITGSIATAVSVYVPDTYVPFTGTLVPDVSGNNLYSSTNGSYIFQSPHTNVKTLLDGFGATDTNFVVMRKYDVTADSSANVILTAGTDELFSEYSITNYVLTTVAGEIVDLTGKVTRGGSPTGTQVTIALGAGYESVNVRVIAAVIRQVALQKSKTVQTQVIPGSALAAGFLSLGKADIISLTSVIDDSTSQDITSSFTLDNGQRRSYYDLGSIQLKAGYPTPASTVTVTFDYFQHSPGDYFSVDSYSVIDYADIPTFVDGTTTYKLTDCFDFRPRINDAGTGFSGTGSSVGNTVKPAGYITADITTYLPRKDKVYLDYRGNFGVVEGTSDLDPKEPQDPNDSMVLYKLYVNPYTVDSKDLVVTYVENKRYTMRDIGKIEKRVDNLEYYTALNELEKKTVDQQVIDPVTGNDRYKNGFFADPFVDHAIGDFGSSEVRCSVDEANSILRAEFDAQGIDLAFDAAASTNVEQHGDLITLPFVDSVLISQPLATHSVNVNPYDIFAWIGRLGLTPSSDYWVDTRYKDPDVTYSENGKKTTNTWLSWATGWSGAQVVDVNDTAASRSINLFGRTITLSNGVKRTTTTVTNTIVDDKLVSKDTVPWIRPKTIKFTALKLKPSTRVYPFFDGVNVSAYCRPLAGVAGAALITNAAGKVEGYFDIPDSTFRTGTKEFKLVDDSAGVDAVSLTTARDNYTAKGILQTRQKTIVSTKETTSQVVYVDPLAQSFMVDLNGGAFITKLSLYFETKDDNIPVSVEIREMENGQPTPNVVPYSSVVVDAASVNVSTDASLATDFVFDTPVYLQQGVEYCFVVMADSTAYNLWVSQMGEQDTVTGKWVTKQPYIGVMFKSQNSSTWTESQLEDIKFQLYRASFTQSSGTVSLKNTDVEMLPLPGQPFLATSGSSVLQVNHPYHGKMIGSLVTYSGATGSAGIADTDLNKTHTVASIIDSDTYTIDVGVLATSDTLMGGNPLASSNIQFNTLRPLVRELILSGTNTSWSMSATTGKSASGSETPYAAFDLSVINTQDLSVKAPLIVLEAAEETSALAGNRSFELVGTLTTDSTNLSPVIDVNRLGAIAIRNRINSPAVLDETPAVVDDIPVANRATCRYINKAVSLDDPATLLKVWFDVQKPSESDVKVFYRVVAADSGDDISSVNWTEMDVVKYATPSGSTSYFEEEHDKDLSATPFTEFQLKLVLISTVEGAVPQIKSLRAVALS